MGRGGGRGSGLALEMRNNVNGGQQSRPPLLNTQASGSNFVPRLTVPQPGTYSGYDPHAMLMSSVQINNQMYESVDNEITGYQMNFPQLVGPQQQTAAY